MSAGFSLPVGSREQSSSLVLTARSPRLLIVHDDLAIRLRLAELLRPTCSNTPIDTASARGAVELGTRLREYTGAVLILEFGGPQGGRDPLTLVQELRAVSRSLALVVIGSQGNERTAVRALRAGALDYWPLHTIDAAELGTTLLGGGRGEALRPAARGSSAAAPTQLPGYRIVKELTRSPRAVLYLADSVELKEQVALKIHRHSDASDASREERDRFARECKLLGQVNHRAVADVFDFGVTDAFHWLALEYFPCGSLKARLQHPLTEGEALAYALQLGHALDAIHAAGMIHRDLKPSNIMLRADDTLALIDFGLARPIVQDSSVTSPHVRVGSPYYMSPEQIEGAAPDARCDLYALGVVMHEMLTGQIPFAGQTVAEVLDQHRTARPPRLPEQLSRFQPVLDRLLAKRPAERWPSARAVVDALTAAGGTGESNTRSVLQ
jgi:tRNA A-37 threonylcarbamoyl transferase component Bud32/ActR/RegA family two-component response regulator